MSIKCCEKKKVRIKTKYLYTITTSNCINDKITTLLYLSNSFARQRRREVIIINNNKFYSSELLSTLINETLIIKHILKNVRCVN